MSISSADAPLGCILDAHQWTAARNELGDYYETCRGCGKQTAWTPVWPESTP